MGTTDPLEYIDHEAEVAAVDMKAGILTLRLSASAECAGCAAARLCNPSGQEMKTLEVAVADAGRYHVGDKVTLRGTERLHRKAIMVATVIPSIALVAVMVAIYLLTADQAAAALGGLAAMVFFFVMLYLMRNRIAHEFTFSVMPAEGPGKRN